MEFNRYIKYFNYGYFLSKYEPNILKNLLKVTEDDSDISEPLSAGKLQFAKEQVQKKLKSLKELSKDEFDKDIEPEI